VQNNISILYGGIIYNLQTFILPQDGRK